VIPSARAATVALLAAAGVLFGLGGDWLMAAICWGLALVGPVGVR
jgi:hypothetical protein